MNQAAGPILGLLLELKRALTLVAPPPKLTVSEWSDKYRVLSGEASAEPGTWDTDRAPYQRGVMDTLNDPLVETTVFMAASQVGKTEMVNNLVGFTIHQDPAPMLVIQPTVEMAQVWSKDRLGPMLRDTPCLQDKVAPPRSRDSDNTILHKQFPGGHISMVGANSPAGLASRPIKRVLADEIDRYEASAGGEGDPVDLAVARTTTFHDRKIFLISSPTEEGVSRIWAAYLESDQRDFYVPCAGCGKSQTLIWAQVKIPKNEKGEYQPQDSFYECPHCKAALHDADLRSMVKRGAWVAAKPFRGVAGFRINQLYSPWVTLAEIATKFRKAKESGNRERLKTFFNTVMGEVWRDLGEGVAKETLLGRGENYTPMSLPKGVLVITAAADVQDTRIELEVKGWGPGFEGWGIEKIVLPGDPTKEQVWDDLDKAIRKTYQSERGHEMRISTTAVDSGYLTQTVYRWCKRRAERRVWAIKGVGGHGRPLIMRPGRDKATRAVFLPLGVDLAKTEIYAQLKMDSPGPAYQHFPKGHGYDKDHFDQLTAEERHIKYNAGIATWVWKKKKSVNRNEALDLAVYNYCALCNLRPSWSALKKAADAKEAQAVAPEKAAEQVESSEEAELDSEPEPSPTPPPQVVAAKKRQPDPRRPSRSGWATRY